MFGKSEPAQRYFPRSNYHQFESHKGQIFRAMFSKRFLNSSNPVILILNFTVFIAMNFYNKI